MTLESQGEPSAEQATSAVPPEQWTPPPATHAAPGRRGPAKWILAIVGAVVIAGAAVGITLAVTGGSGSKDAIAQYGQTSTQVAAKLKTCPTHKAYGDVLACTNYDGSTYQIVTEKDADSQNLFVAMMKDQDQGTCAIVIPGVVIGGADELALTGAVGVPESFAAAHKGYVLCPL